MRERALWEVLMIGEANEDMGRSQGSSQEVIENQREVADSQAFVNESVQS